MTLLQLVNSYCIDPANKVTTAGHTINYHINLRRLTISPYIRVFATAILNELADRELDALASTIEGADLVVGCLSQGPLSLRGATISRDNKIKGNLRGGDRVVILQGIATNDHTLRKSIKVLRELKCEIVEIISVIELTTTGRAYASSEHIAYRSLIKKIQLRLEL